MANRAIDIPNSGKPLPLSRVGHRRQVIIPKSVFDALQLKEGDFMEVTTEEGRVSMKPKRPVDALTSAESNKVRHALKQARSGKTRPWDVVKHELGL